MRVKVWGSARLGSLPRPRDEPLRRQHLLRRRYPLRRNADGARCGHRDPQPRPGAGRRAYPGEHPAHPPAPRPHPGPDLLRPLLPPADRDRDLGPGLARGLARDRIARYISAPLTPVEVRELPWTSPSAARRPPSGRSARRGSAPTRSPTAAPRSATGSTTGPDSLAYIPDHEPALGADLEKLEDEWIAGFGLAEDASLLIHDGQYADAEYPDHLGWVIRRSRTRSASPAAAAPAARCCSTTTRCTPTNGSTGWARKRASAGRRKAATPARSSSASRGRSWTCGRARPVRSLQSKPDICPLSVRMECFLRLFRYAL